MGYTEAEKKERARKQLAFAKKEGYASYADWEIGIQKEQDRRRAGQGHTKYSSTIDGKVLTKRKAGLPSEKKKVWSSKDIKEGRAGAPSREQVEMGAETPQIKPGIGQKPTIDLGKWKPKTGIAAYRERGGFLPGVVKAITSPLTTAVLGATLVSLLTFGGGAAALGFGTRAAATVGVTARITRTATLLQGALRGTSMTTQRAFVGRTAASGIDKIFHAVRPTATRFATNPKSIALTKSFLVKLGLGIGAAGITLGAVGTYPFSNFIKEEALQTLNIPIFKAVNAGDLEGAEILIKEVDEMLEQEKTFMDKIPYLNVQKSLQGYFTAARIANEEWKRVISIRKQELSGERETQFARERRETDEAARERELAEREEDEEYWEQIQKEREEKEREASEREKEEMAWKAEYYNLIREGRYEEAEELLKANS